MANLEFFYDIGSPYSYLASCMVEGIAAECRTTLVWRPFLLGGVLKATGNHSPIETPSKAVYHIRDLERWAAFYGVGFHFSPHFPLNTLTAMRVITATPVEERPALSLEMFRAVWHDRRNLSDLAVLAAMVGPERMAAAGSDAVKNELRATTEEAVKRGAFGAPTFFVGDEMFWGNDRMMFVERRLRELA